MKLHKTIKRFQNGVEPETLQMGARDIGHELPRNRLAVLAQFRQMLSELPPSDDDYVTGYRDAVRNILAAYEAAVNEKFNAQYTEMFKEHCTSCSCEIVNYSDMAGGYRFCKDGCPQNTAWTNGPVYSHYNPPPGYGVCTRDPEHDGPCAHPLLNDKAP